MDAFIFREVDVSRHVYVIGSSGGQPFMQSGDQSTYATDIYGNLVVDPNSVYGYNNYGGGGNSIGRAPNDFPPSYTASYLQPNQVLNNGVISASSTNDTTDGNRQKPPSPPPAYENIFGDNN